MTEDIDSKLEAINMGNVYFSCRIPISYAVSVLAYESAW